MSHIALVNYEASTLRIYVETSTVSIISDSPRILHIMESNKFDFTFLLNM